MTRVILFAVPALTVLVVAFSLLVVAAPRPVVGARIHGGPTPDGQRLSVRIEVTEQRGMTAHLVPHRRVEITLRDGPEAARWEGDLDDEGSANAVLEVSGPLSDTPSLVVDAEWAREPLAVGTLEARSPRWKESARVHGGWVRSPTQGELSIRVAPGDGVLAVPFDSSLWVEVMRQGRPVADVELTPNGESLEVVRVPTNTNERGRTTLRVRPLAHIAALELRARSPNGDQGRWYSTLPIVGGAQHARLASGELVVTSPILRERAYFAFITREGRHLGGVVLLEPNERGGAVGSVTVRPPRPLTGWIAVSSEADLGAPSTVGWPVKDAERAFLEGKTAGPPQSVAIPDLLLLDGVAPLLDQERVRQQRVRRVTGMFVAAAMTLVVMLLLLRVRDSEQRLRAHLTRTAGEDGAKLVEPSTQRWLGILVAILCVMLGFLILVLLTLLRV